MTDAAQNVWNEERLGKLKELWASGMSITRIGVAIGVSRNAVAGKVHRMGLAKRQSPIIRSDKPAVAPPRRRSPRLALTDWDRHKCSWPIGDPRSGNFHFCGAAVSEGRPYCAEHCAKAYTDNSKSVRVVKTARVA